MCITGLNNNKIFRANKKNPIITMQKTITANANMNLNVFSIQVIKN